MTRLRTSVTLLLLCAFAGFSLAQQKINIQGVWEKLSTKQDGRELPPTGRQWKTITTSHWTWIYQDSKEAASLFAKKTHEDSLMAYLSLGAGAGTYTLSGNTYTETPEFFQELEYIGVPLEFTVKVEGNRMFQTGKFPVFEGGKKVRELLLEEVFKRIE
jgi:hypothetical protein